MTEQINRLMNAWMREWVKEWMNKWTNEWMNERINEWMNECMNLEAGSVAYSCLRLSVGTDNRIDREWISKRATFCPLDRNRRAPTGTASFHFRRPTSSHTTSSPPPAPPQMLLLLMLTQRIYRENTIYIDNQSVRPHRGSLLHIASLTNPKSLTVANRGSLWERLSPGGTFKRGRHSPKGVGKKVNSR